MAMKDVIFPMALSNKDKLPHPMFFRVDYRENTLICGGSTGSAAEDVSLRLLEHQIYDILRNRLPAVILSADRMWTETIFRNYGQRILTFGAAVSYDPFCGCSTMDEVRSIMTDVIRVYFRNDENHSGNASEESILQNFCDCLFEVLYSNLGMQGITYHNFEIIADAANQKGSLFEFFKFLAEKNMNIPESVQTAMNRDLKIFSVFCDFWRKFRSSLSVFRTKNSSPEYSAAELLAMGQQFLFQIDFSSESALAAAAVYCELRRAVRRQEYCLINYNVPVPAKAGAEIFDSRTVGFAMYFDTLYNKIMLPSVAGSVDNLICVGANYEDARQLSQMWGESEHWMMDFGTGGFGAHKVTAPRIYPTQLMPDTRHHHGIIDGGAAVFSRQHGIHFCEVLLV